MTAWNSTLVLLLGGMTGIHCLQLGARKGTVKNLGAGRERSNADTFKYLTAKDANTGGGSQHFETEAVPMTALKVSGGETSETTSTGSSKLRGRLTLVFVAFLFGTLNVALRQLYAMPNPPTASALSFTRGWLAAACFFPMVPKMKKGGYASDDSSSVNKVTPLWMAALELAFWNFGAQGLLNVGLLFTESARASFLTQTSVVITPLISVLAGQAVNRSVWVGCTAALAGLVLLSGGGGAAVAAGVAAESKGIFASLLGVLSSLTFSTGDLLVLGGAVSWSMYIFRVSSVGTRYPEIPLQAMKTTLLATLYSTWFVASAVRCYMTGGWADVASLWLGWKNMQAWLLLAFSAIGPGALADILQQQAQKEVSASEANVILCGEPVFTAICARLFLGETTSPRENAGGGLIVLAALLASSSGAA